jgi:pyruvate dehydrogenase E2 component (dihydrolipoamide acetyltransferase)
MATDVIIPVLGMSQDSGLLVQWLKQPGDAVRAGEVLFEVETDKAVVEIEAPADGVLGPWLVGEGEVVPVTEVVARIYAPGEAANAPAITPSPPASPAAPRLPTATRDGQPASSPPPASPLAARVAAAHQVDLAQVQASGSKIHKADVLAYLAAAEQESTGKVLASPKARRLAQQRGVALGGLRGSGPDNAVLAADVLAWQPPSPVSPPETAIPAAASAEPAALTIPISNTWRIMAERTTLAWTTTPHFFLQRRALAGALLAWQHSVQSRTEAKITTSDLLVMLCARALARHPQVNHTWQNGGIVASQAVNVGLAVAAPDGLVVPVIRHADQLSLSEIARARYDLVAKARAGRLRLDDITGGTFTISNLGMFGVERFLAVLNPPQAAILAVGAIHDQVLPIDGQPAIRSVLELTVTFDHRVVDGAAGARFLQTLVAWIEEPLQLLEQPAAALR